MFDFHERKNNLPPRVLTYKSANNTNEKSILQIIFFNGANHFHTITIHHH